MSSKDGPRKKFHSRSDNKDQLQKTLPTNHLGIPPLTLRYDGSSNFWTWNKAYSNAMEREFGRFGTFCSTRKMGIPKAPPEPQYRRVSADTDTESKAVADRSNRATEAMYIQALKDHAKDKRRFHDLLITQWAYTWEAISQESQNKVKQIGTTDQGDYERDIYKGDSEEDEEDQKSESEMSSSFYEYGQTYSYNEAKKAHDVLGLLNMLELTHAVASVGTSALGRQVAAENLYKSLRQGDFETVAVFYERFQQSVYTLSTSGAIVPTQPKLAYEFVGKLDPRRFGSWQVELQNHLVAGRDNYPKTPTDAYNVASSLKTLVTTNKARFQSVSKPEFMQEKIHVTLADAMKKKDTRVKGKVKDKFKKHKDIPPKARSESEVIRSKRTGEPVECFECGENHYKSDCPRLKDSSDVVHKETVNMALTTEATKLPVTRVQLKHGVYMVAAVERHVVAVASSKVEEGLYTLLLDSTATTSIFCNPKLLHNIREAENKVYEVTGVGGTIQVRTVGSTQHFGDCLYAPECGVNILSLQELWNNGCKVEFNNEERKATLTTRDGTSYIFRMLMGGLLGTLVSDELLYVTTVASNEAKYNERILKRIKKIPEIRERLNFLSDAELASMISRGSMTGIPTTVQDLSLHRNIYGRDKASIRGKTRLQKPRIKAESTEDIYSRNCDLHVDIVYFFGKAYLLGVLKPNDMTMVEDIQGSRHAEQVEKGLMSMISLSSRHGCRIVTIYCDPEKSVSKLKQSLERKLIGTIIDIGGVGQHESVAENRAGQVRRRVKASVSALPYKMPLIFCLALLSFIVGCLNFVPRSTNHAGVSPYEALTGEKPDYPSDCRASFGQRVEVEIPYTSTGVARSIANTEPGMILYPVGNKSKSWHVYLFKRKKVVRRDHWIELPADSEFIRELDALNAIYGYMSPEGFYRKAPNDSNELLELDHAEDEAVAAEDDDEFQAVTGPRITQPSAEIAQDANESVQVEAPAEFVTNNNADERTFIQDANLPPPRPPPPTVPTVPAPHAFNPKDLIDSETPGVRYRGAEEVLSNILENDHKESDFEPPNEVENAEQENTEADNAPTMEGEHHVPLTFEDVRPKRLRQPNSRYAGSEWVLKAKTSKVKSKLDIALTNTDSECKQEKYLVYNLSVREARQEYGESTDTAVSDELRGMLKKGVFHPLTAQELANKADTRAILPCKMFLKPKYKNGVFQLLKARLVAGGHRQDRSLIPDSSSPTVCKPALFITAAIAAQEKRKVVTVDIGKAYLNADITGVKPLMKLGKELVDTLETMPEWLQKYGKFQQRTPDGGAIVELDKALYGCVESSYLWYEHIRKTLEQAGYRVNPVEPCSFNKTRQDGVQCTIILHVDDLFITTVSETMIKELLALLKRRYEDISVHEGDIHDYLGMRFVFKSNKVEISMVPFIKDLLLESRVNGIASTPAGNDLYIQHDSVILSKERQNLFHTYAAKILYLSTLARPDLWVSATYLATRVQCANEKDEGKLYRVLRYLNGTRDLALTLGADPGVPFVSSYVDASFGIFDDAKSQTGCSVSLGTGSVYAKTSKQKIVTKSSTEAELVALTDSSSQIIWTREYLHFQGYNQRSAKVYEDNASTILLAEKGRSLSARTRHVKIRYFFIKERIDNGELSLEYLPTGEMVADILTKPLQGEHFLRLRKKLMGEQTLK